MTVKIEFDNVSATKHETSPGFLIGNVLRNLADAADAKMMEVPFEYPILDRTGSNIGTMTVDLATAEDET